MSLVYAIDFGTSNSLLAAADSRTTHAPIPLERGTSRDPTILRTLLYFPTQEQCFYGTEAVEQFLQNEMQGRFLRSLKRFLPVRSFIGTWIENRPMNLENLIALFLSEMRKRANEHFGEDVDSVVLGRPARFSRKEEDDRFAEARLEKAAKLAGFRNITFCPEPVAAAREYRLGLDAGEKTVLVADFGGGTSDYTIVRLGERAFRDEDVLAIGGEPIAGDALDGALMRNRVSHHFGATVEYQAPFGSNTLTMPKMLMEKLCAPSEISLLRARETQEFFRNVQAWSLGADDRKKMDQLFTLIQDQQGFGVFEEIERVKRALSENEREIFSFLYPPDGSAITISEEVSRGEFEEYTSSQVEKILAALDETLALAGLKSSQIDIVCCTGGTARVRAIHDGLVARFGTGKIKQHNHFHSIAVGLGERAAELART